MPYKKSSEKREMILRKASEVFRTKGYAAVSMTDIIDACGISKGGIYLYFKSVREIFETLLSMQEQEEKETAHSTAEDPLTVLWMYLQTQKEEVLSPKEHMVVALYEYLFSVRNEIGEEIMAQRFKTATDRLAAVIEACDHKHDPVISAQKIVLFIEGLRVSSIVMPLDEDMVERQMRNLMEEI